MLHLQLILYTQIQSVSTQLVGNFPPFVTHTYEVGSFELAILQQYSVSGSHTTVGTSFSSFDPSTHTFWDARPGEHLFAFFWHPFAILPEFPRQQYGLSSPQVFWAPSYAQVSPCAVGNGVGGLVGGRVSSSVGFTVGLIDKLGRNEGWFDGCADTDGR